MQYLVHATIAGLTWAFLAPAPVAVACIHGPAKYQGKIEEKGQVGLVIHHAGREELILRVDYGVKAGKAPERLAWVVPVPSNPDHYATVHRRVFSELASLTAPRVRRAARGPVAKGAKSMGTGIVLLEPSRVGPYDIQPIAGQGRESGPALNTWLTGHGFQAVKKKTMAWYLDAGWTFLAIGIGPEKGQKRLDPAGSLRPLRISFASDRIVYPLKFSSHQGSFPVTLYVLTRSGLKSVAKEQARSKGFDVTSRHELWRDEERAWWLGRRPGSDHGLALRTHAHTLYDLLRKIQREARMDIPARLTLTKLQAKRVNSRSNRLSKWAEDFALTP